MVHPELNLQDAFQTAGSGSEINGRINLTLRLSQWTGFWSIETYQL